MLGTSLGMSTEDHPRTDGQPERKNCFIGGIVRSVNANTLERWILMLPVVQFALNNDVHASTGFTPFYVNGFTHPRAPLTLFRSGSGIGGGEIADRLAEISRATVYRHESEFIATLLNVLRHVRDALADS